MKISDESKRWVEMGIIDEGARESILALYEKKRSMSLVFVLFAVLGSLLLGAGIVLILATNWENISRNAKLFIAFLPLIAAVSVFMFTFLKKQDSAAWREGSALGLSISMFATIALVGQVFHIPYTIEEFVRLCAFLSLPAMYLMKSKSTAVLYTVCIICGGVSTDFPLLTALGTSLFAPFFVMQIKKTEHKGVLLLLSVLAGALSTMCVFNIPGDLEVIDIKFLTCAILLCAFDAVIRRYKNSTAATPITVLSNLAIIIVLLVTSFQAISASFEFGDELYIFLPFILSIGAYAALRFYKQPFTTVTADAVILCAALGFPRFWLWSNFLLAALGVWLIVSGVKSLSLKPVNFGMLVVISVILARFFDSDLGFMERGIAFIVVGAGFFFTNFILHKKWRAK